MFNFDFLHFQITAITGHTILFKGYVLQYHNFLRHLLKVFHSILLLLITKC